MTPGRRSSAGAMVERERRLGKSGGDRRGWLERDRRLGHWGRAAAHEGVRAASWKEARGDKSGHAATLLLLSGRETESWRRLGGRRSGAVGWDRV